MSKIAKEKIDLLVSVDYLFPMDNKVDVIYDAELAVKDGKIFYIGEKRPSHVWDANEIIRTSSKAMLPGFVNSHCHTASTVFRSQTDDGQGGAALYSIGFRGEGIISPDDWKILAYLGTIEMILAGYTTLNDFWYCPEVMAEISLITGMRMQLASEILDVDKSKIMDGDWSRVPKIGKDTLKFGVDFVKNYNNSNNGLITTRLGPHAVDTCSKGLHREIHQEAKNLGVGLHCHVAQSKKEVDFINKESGLGPATFLAELGVLGPDWVLAHLTFADSIDIRSVADCGSSNAHAATIYARRGSQAPLGEIQAIGINCGLASDWMINDPWEGMRVVSANLRLLEQSHKGMESIKALEFATSKAAKVIGFGDKIGQLTKGYEADFILVNLDHPHLQPFYGTPSSLVWYARPEDVSDSFVRGRALMRDRKIINLDYHQAIQNVKQRTAHFADQMRSLGGVSNGPNCPCGYH